MDHHRYKIKVEYCVSFVVLMIGVFFFFQAMTIETSDEAVGPRTMPLILAVSMIVSGCWLGLRAYLDKVGDLTGDYGFLESDKSRIFAILFCGIFFVLMFWGFGYFAALFSCFIATLYAFGNRSWVRMVCGAILLAIVFQWLFMGVMMLSDPAGNFVDLRPYTNWIKGE